jgi:hypothetical protein
MSYLFSQLCFVSGTIVGFGGAAVTKKKTREGQTGTNAECYMSLPEKERMRGDRGVSFYTVPFGAQHEVHLFLKTWIGGTYSLP